MSEGADLFPAFLKLRGRKVVVVGGGTVAATKLAALVRAGSDITVVAPEISAGIEREPVTLVRRAFAPDDLDGAWLVVAAASPEVNRAVAAAAAERRIFVNAVDDPANASAYAAATLRRDGVTVAVSTDGHAPALAGLLREALDALLPDDLETWVSKARALRRPWRAQGIPMAARRPLLLDALNRLYADRAATTSSRPPSKEEQ